MSNYTLYISGIISRGNTDQHFSFNFPNPSLTALIHLGEPQSNLCFALLQTFYFKLERSNVDVNEMVKVTQQAWAKQCQAQ